ncbi:MAG: cation-transporting P-type ATPase, partial [Propionibacteriaceae bacterium]|nr:cation-transporting P-type ATPase [Propionibacteriaceae bacterium]
MRPSHRFGTAAVNQDSDPGAAAPPDAGHTTLVSERHEHHGAGGATHNTDSQLEQDYKAYAAGQASDVATKLNSALTGLSEAEAASRLAKNGKNTTSSAKPKPWYVFAAKSFADEFIIVLLLLGVISLTPLIGDPLGASIIFILAVVSAVIRFTQDYTSYLSSEKLKTMLHTTADVRRDGTLVKKNIED